MKAELVVTRHSGLVEYLRQEGIVSADAEVRAHVTPDDVVLRHVVGVLPLHLAALAASVTEVPLDLPPEMRGVELTADDVRRYAKPPVRYVVDRIDEGGEDDGPSDAYIAQSELCDLRGKVRELRALYASFASSAAHGGACIATDQRIEQVFDSILGGES